MSMPHRAPGMEFFTDFVVTGAVGGADATRTPAEVTGLLGGGFVESLTGPGQLLRCYDPVELAWQRDTAGECETAGVLDRAEAVCEIARYGLLAPDAAVRTCLEAIPVSRADVATRETTPYTEEHLVAVNASRAAKRLTLAAGPLLPRVRDPELRAEVRAWLDLRPRLM